MARRSQRGIPSPNLEYSLNPNTQTGWLPPAGFLFAGLSSLNFPRLKGKTGASFFPPNK